MHTRFFWPRMDVDITDYIRHCDTCQRTKYHLPNRPEMGQIADQSTKPLQFWSIDFQGPFKTSSQGNRYILTAVDYASKWVEALATPDCSAVTTAKFILEQIILRHGTPHTIHTDQGANFESKLISQLCSIYNIKKSRSSPYHPEGNGAVERENRSI
jgi:transposase InsO family protein